MRFPPRKPIQSFASIFRRFFRNIEGTTAVELSFVLLPFLIVLFAIIETGYVFLTQMVVEGATATASRQVRVGSVQQSANPLEQFIQTLCDNTGTIVPCEELILDVRSFANFPDISLLPEVPDDDGAITFDLGSPGDIVLVRVVYQWDWITPFLRNQIQPEGKRFIASAIFRVEPFLGALQ